MAKSHFPDISTLQETVSHMNKRKGELFKFEIRQFLTSLRGRTWEAERKTGEFRTWDTNIRGD